AVTAARHPQPPGIHPGILFQRRIHTRHHVLIIHAAPVVDDSPLELLSIARGTAWIAEKHRPTFARVDLELVIPVHAVLPRRPAVNTHHHRIALARLPSNRLHEKTIDVPAVRALVGQTLHRRGFQPGP